MRTAGPAEQSRAAVAGQIDHVLRTAVHGGIEDATMLDYLYVVERLRRWGTTGERSGVVSPLLVPAFVRSAFALSPTQRVQNALHRDLVRRLIPEWADIPFFKPVQAAAPRPKTPARIRCLADAPDRDLIQQLLEDVEGFDRHALSTLWAASAAGASSAAGEAALQQALWRATFDQHLDQINQHLPESARPVVVVPAQPGSTPAPAAKAPVRRIARQPVVRRLAATPVWKAFRRTRLGSSWRSLTQ
jgi:hypothetical protein